MALERSALALVGDVIGLLDLEEFCVGLLRTLREAIPAEFCALNEVPAELPHTISITDPPVGIDIHHAFAGYAPQNPIAITSLTQDATRQLVVSDLQSLGLTRGQAEVLRLIAMGHSSQAAAASLAISARTVQNTSSTATRYST